MAQLPVRSGVEAIRAFERAGWMRVRQRGSHVSLHKPEIRELLTIRFIPLLIAGFSEV
jgi:predicted RNA binding protein YcfA (HicA-like mRNA interferase family)